MTRPPFTPRKDPAAAADELRRIFPPGSTARTILRHVAPSGMTRWVSVISPDCEDVTWLVAAALGEKIHERGGQFAIRVPGVGMDVGFHLVYSLSATLYRDGWPCQKNAPGGRCPSNHHVNPGHEQLEPIHTDGYAVSQAWL